ncbi:MAG: hypothetical protein ACOYJK_01250 [Prevotella sp.]|jgi:hypothetical protein
MRKIFLLVFMVVITALASTSCRMAPSNNLGDTVEAKYFEPYDSTIHDTAAAKKQLVIIQDSLDIYVIGPASTASQVQLLSYPSRRDSMVYTKGKHIKVIGNADFYHVVRAKFWISEAGDTLVTRLEEMKDLPLGEDETKKEDNNPQSFVIE